MRQKYPGLTDEQSVSQVRDLRDRLSEAKIEELVESICRPRVERAMLADTLKARRQYLIDKFLV
ncbi:MAG: hypothetical protein QG629_779 [Patescibacteria group bacterium]|nr:hypothetical protein [Candidatus Saccharibacteria bacterium]MDQ5963696.1 hypothetical protein [Patescibacteria group bacterium]